MGKSASTQNLTYITALRNKLSEFGLDPRKWKIIPQGHDRYKVSYTDDDMWFFFGQSTERENEPRWTRLQLASL